MRRSQTLHVDRPLGRVSPVLRRIRVPDEEAVAVNVNVGVLPANARRCPRGTYWNFRRCRRHTDGRRTNAGQGRERCGTKNVAVDRINCIRITDNLLPNRSGDFYCAKLFEYIPTASRCGSSVLPSVADVISFRPIR